MARKRKEITVRIAHKYVHNPEAVERGLELWATYLSQHLAKRLAEEVRSRGTA